MRPVTEKTLTIRSLRPNVTEADAFRLLESSGPAGVLKRTRLGPIARLAMVYIPFRPFRASVHNLNRTEEMFVAIDAVAGSLDLYQFGSKFESSPLDSGTVTVKTSNVPVKRLPLPELESRLRDRLRRTVFRKGFFSLRELRLEVHALPDEVCVPYWVGFRGHGGRAHVDVLDAVRRSPEGGKVRRLIEEWLAEE